MSKRPIFRIDGSHYALVVRRPVAILMVTLAVGVFGFVSYQRLALTLMPDMSYPTLTVRTSYPGTAPEEMENVVSRPLEQQLGIIPKLVSISSVSKAAQSDVMLEFQWKTDMDLVAQEVREKIDRIRLPEGAQRPLLLHYDPSLDPILRLGLAGPQSLYELRHLAENDVKRKLEAITGVAAVQIKGGLEEQFLVALDESKLANLRLDIGQITTRLQQGNVNMSGGNLREGQTEYLIRTLNEFRTLEEIGTVIIARQNGVDIRLRDVATVSRFHEDRQVITRVNGHESVEIEIYKEADANVLVVAAAVKAAIFGTAEQQAYVNDLKNPAARATAPPVAAAKKTPAASGFSKGDGGRKMKQSPAEMARAQIEAQRNSAQQLINHRRLTDFLAYQVPPASSIQLLSDQSVFIANSIREVKENAIFGGLIAIAVLYLFLRNVTQTLIVSLCIPVSILATFAPMHMAGVSLNIISLGGLALGVGNLVDNAIVVLESIFRCREEGDDPVTAVVRGTSEVAMPVVASTLTTVAVFFPIVFVEGVAGQVFGDMALAVVFSQIASLIAALYLIPMLASKAAGAVKSGGAAGLPQRPMMTQLRSSDILQFPVHQGQNRIIIAFVTLGLVAQRIGWGVAVILGAAIKTTISLVVTPVAFLLAPLPATRPAAARIGQWLAADYLGPIESVRVWPGMLSFTAVSRLGASIARCASWLFARPWRWTLLLVLPAIAITIILIQRVGVVVPPAMPVMTGTPMSPAAAAAAAAAAKPFHLAVWHWFVPKPWWLLILLFVPGAVPFAFVVARTITEITLRLLGSTAQTVVLVVVQLLIGTVRA
ncbi:MAG: efflux RND transporter permease subunit, partial [Opitutaceae bacterium]